MLKVEKALITSGLFQLRSKPLCVDYKWYDILRSKIRKIVVLRVRFNVVFLDILPEEARNSEE